MAINTITIDANQTAIAESGFIGVIETKETEESTPVYNGFRMNWQRDSEKTYQKDGILKTAGINYPTVQEINGVKSINTEPQAENLFKNSGFAGELTPPQDWAGSLVGKKVVDSIYGDLVKAIEFDVSAGQNYIQQEVSLLAGSKYCLSVKIESFDGVTNIQNIMNIYGLTGTETYFEDNIEIPFSKAIESGKMYKLVADVTSDSLSAMVRLGSGTTSSAPAKVVFSSPQIKLGENITSFILSPIGSTATRLADTGIKSDDLSRWIKRGDFSIEIDVKRPFYFDLDSRITLSDNTSNNRVSFRFWQRAGVYRFNPLITSNNVAVTNSNTEFTFNEDRNKLRIDYTDTNVKVYMNNSELADINHNNTMQTLKTISLSTSSGTQVYIGDLFEIKITS